MIYLSVEELTKHVPDKLLFENLRFDLKKGEKIGLVANNGTGKSSLLKILMGRDEPDGGKVFLRPTIKAAFLEQDPHFEAHMSINELIESEHTDLLAVIRNYEQALADQSENYTEQTQKRFETASAAMDQQHAWDYERRLKQLLDQFRITDLDQDISSLSGGQRKRLAMAMALLDEPDLLVLDEPTNHLDVEMIEWLEKYLMQSNISIFMVTHDRYFLDRICNQIYELHQGKLYIHNGNYGYFLQKRSEREAAIESEIDKAGKLMKKELEWMRRSPKARGTKAKSRVNAFYDIKDKANSKVQKDELNIDMKMSRVGGKILELKKVYKSYGDTKILEGFDHTFKKGERIGIVGKNGVGKSTFLNIINSKETADSGKVNIGDTTVFGYYSQGGLQPKENKRVIDILKDVADVITLGDGRKVTASQFLNSFAFPPKMQRTFFSDLSGGEKRRLFLLTVLMNNPNFLILDEPTNDLDLLTLNKLEEFLQSYSGCLIVVSHDRYFMERLTDQLFVFEGNGKVRGYLGNYKDFREEQEELKKQVQKEKSETKPRVKERKEKKLSFKEKREYESLEGEIAELEEEKQVLETKLAETTSDYDLLQKTTVRLGEVIDLIDEKSMRWLELDEIA